jgi:hypothetical protein
MLGRRNDILTVARSGPVGCCHLLAWTFVRRALRGHDA